MIRSLRDSKAHLSELVEQASRGEDVLITVRGKVRARLTQAVAPETGPDIAQWRKEVNRVTKKYQTQRKGTATERILEDLREDRF
jgi:prevent-host-death family protein